MKRAFAVEEHIPRPGAEVWAALTDWHNAPRWMPGIDSLSADGPLEAGTTLVFNARGRDRTAEIARCEPQRSLVLRSVQGSVVAEYTYTVSDTGADQTRVELVATCRAGGPWLPFGPVLRMAIRRTDGGQLAALKDLIEQT